MSTTRTRQYEHTPIDVRVVLSALWIAVLFVFAYVDIFGFYRADVLKAALAGDVADTAFDVNQVFLASTLAYIVPAVLMVALSLVLGPRANRMTNITVSALYAATILVSCLGETWVYYLLGSAIELALLLVIAHTARKWPPVTVTLSHRPPSVTSRVRDGADEPPPPGPPRASRRPASRQQASGQRARRQAG